MLLDLSATFHTVAHKIKMDHLSTRVWIRGSALTSFKSYLSDWSQKVTVKGHKSTSPCLNCGVPQGFILGQLVFSIYILQTICNHDLNYNLYAMNYMTLAYIIPKQWWTGHMVNLDTSSTCMESTTVVWQDKCNKMCGVQVIEWSWTKLH